jgi:hypothetical protein
MSKEDRVSRTLLHINDLHCEISVINPPAMGCWIRFVYLNGEKLYAVANETLYVYLMIDTTSPVATFSLSSDCYSGEIFNNRLYLGGKIILIYLILQLQSCNHSHLSQRLQLRVGYTKFWVWVIHWFWGRIMDIWKFLTFRPPELLTLISSQRDSTSMIL